MILGHHPHLRAQAAVEAIRRVSQVRRILKRRRRGGIAGGRMWHLSRAAAAGGGRKRRERSPPAAGEVSMIVESLVEAEGRMREKEEDEGTEGMMKGRGEEGGQRLPQAVAQKPLPVPTLRPHLPNIVLHQDLKRYTFKSYKRRYLINIYSL